MSESVKLTPNPWKAACPSRQLLGIIGQKWALLLLPILMEGPQRHGELMRRVEGISQKMLTQTLRNLELYGLIERHDFQTVPPHVEYRLSLLGGSLAQLIGQIDQWVINHFWTLQKADE